MGVSLRVNLQGDEKLARALQRITLSDNPYLLAPVFRRWAHTGEAVAKEDYLSGPRPQKLGVVTHRLRSSVGVSVFDPRDGGAIEFGTDVVYGPTHEFGDPSRNIPARPFIAPAAEEAFRDVPDDIVRTWEDAL